MWKDELIKDTLCGAESVKKSITQKSNYVSEENKNIGEKAIKFAKVLIDDLKKSYTIHIDEGMYEFIGNETNKRYKLSNFDYNKFIKESFPMHLPYDNMLIEVPISKDYSKYMKQCGAGSKVAYILTSDGNFQTMRRAIWKDDIGAWEIHMILLIYDKITNNADLISIQLDDLSNKEKSYMSMVYIAGMYLITIVLELLNCKNIASRKVIPSEKLNRNRVKKGKLPLYEYHVLEVVKDLSGKAKQELEAKPLPWGYKVPEDKRLHMCRGHFKVYSEERPLFGRYYGKFWWGPHMRGKEELGVVDKDYSLKASEK